MNKQLILCFECDKISRTDHVYYRCTIEQFYHSSVKITETPIYMGSKSKYNNRKTIQEISKAKRSFSGETYVIYFIDEDQVTAKPEDEKTLTEIKNYCHLNAYDLVLFNKDVEDVFWGKTVCNNEKVAKAAEYRRKQKITTVNEAYLSATRITRHKSNILTILDKYWIRKWGKDNWILSTQGLLT